MTLSTKTYGSGPRRIALVHGLAADGALWKGLTDRIVALGDTTVITVDLAGHGESPRSDTYTVAGFADGVVEALPEGLDVIVGHSLGGAVVERAVARLRPARAVYLDPGLALALPTTGVKGRAFWAVAPLALGVAAIAQKRKGQGRRPFSPEDAALRDAALAAFDKRMTVGVFRDIAFHPAPVAAPAVPSTLVLSDDSPAVVPDAVVSQLEDLGWGVRRLSGLGHDFWLEDPDRTWDGVSDLFA